MTPPSFKTFRSLNSYLADVGYIDGLDVVIAAISDGASQIQEQVQTAALKGVLGTTTQTNVQGEEVQKLDAIASAVFVDTLGLSKRVAAIGCEEIEGTVVLGDGAGHDFIVQMDPLDGSSNLDVAVSIGSIFGIWRRDMSEPISDRSLLRPGKEQVAAVYVVYGPSTVLVMATQNSVQGFTFDPHRRCFYLTHPDIRIPDTCMYYSVNEGNLMKFDGVTKKNVAGLRDDYSLRYVGSLVADFHRNLLAGGVFLYPKDSSNPAGKLRLMYEANPLGFIAEQAGGAASSGDGRILDICPENPHQRTPLIIGNKSPVRRTTLNVDRE